MNATRITVALALVFATARAHADSSYETPPPAASTTPSIEVHVEITVPPTTNAVPPTQTYVSPPPSYALPPPPYVLPPPVYVSPPPPAEPAYPLAYAPLPRPVRVPYHGGPIPDGAYLRTHHNRAMIAAGAALLGEAYIISALGALWCGIDTDCADQQVLLVPLLGPVLAMGSSRLGDGSRAWLAFDAVAQIGGLVLLVAGNLVTQRELVYPNGREARTTWSVAPFAQRNAAGMSLMATF